MAHRNKRRNLTSLCSALQLLQAQLIEFLVQCLQSFLLKFQVSLDSLASGSLLA